MINVCDYINNVNDNVASDTRKLGAVSFIQNQYHVLIWIYMKNVLWLRSFFLTAFYVRT